MRGMARTLFEEIGKPGAGAEMRLRALPLKMKVKLRQMNVRRIAELKGMPDEPRWASPDGGKTMSPRFRSEEETNRKNAVAILDEELKTWSSVEAALAAKTRAVAAWIGAVVSVVAAVAAWVKTGVALAELRRTDRPTPIEAPAERPEPTTKEDVKPPDMDKTSAAEDGAGE